MDQNSGWGAPAGKSLSLVHEDHPIFSGRDENNQPNFSTLRVKHNCALKGKFILEESEIVCKIGVLWELHNEHHVTTGKLENILITKAILIFS